MKPKLVVEQKITAFVNRYTIYEAQPDGSKGQLAAFVEQKRLTFKEKITFFSNKDKTEVLFTLRAEKVLDIHGRYFIEDAAGKNISSLKKDFGQSLINSTWNILDASDQPSLKISESNQTLAIFRRFGGMVPIVGGLIELLTIFLRYHFSIAEVNSKQVIGKYQKTTLLRDHYLLSMEDTAFSQIDWRVLAALAVALDALQSR